MELHWIDVTVLVAYLVGMIAIGVVAERRARAGLGDYFLGGNRLPWWLLSLSNAASMFDISGTMWLVSLLYVYGVKSVFLPWLWPVFNQIFLMVYLSAWLRRSGAMTGAEWITLRFGSDRGSELSRLSVVAFALVSVIGFTGYAFVGIAKFSEVFLPDALSPNTYALIIIGVTTLYTVMGGLYSVVLTDLIQFVIMLVCSLAIGVIAMNQVSPEALASVVPDGWSNLMVGWRLDVDWTTLMPAAQARIESDGYTLFGALLMMMVFKGVLVSAAGPAPNYDMQRILAAKDARQAAMMSGLVTVVLFSPRYFMVAGIAVLALAMLQREMVTGGELDFEQVLPLVIREFAPVGLAGLMIAGLLAAFMSTFAGTINAAAVYIVNDVYKRYFRPRAAEREYLRVSYAASLGVVVLGCSAGLFTPSVHAATDWIVAALWGGYAAPNVLKWHWWRLNGYGYFWGMAAGIGGAIALLFFPEVKPLMAFPLLFACSLLGAWLGSVLTPPTAQESLLAFYTRTRPWGGWSPILRSALDADPTFQRNRDFFRDAFNVVVGVVWQTAFVVAPVYLVLRDWRAAALSAGVIALTSAMLYRFWYRNLSSL